jgi:hypothetical protein
MIRDQEIMENAWVLASAETRTKGFGLLTRHGWLIGLAAAALIVTLFSLCALGQTSGRISDTVKDMTGAVIPKGTVTATNIATGIKLSTVANDSGALFISLTRHRLLFP